MRADVEIDERTNKFPLRFFFFSAVRTCVFPEHLVGSESTIQMVAGGLSNWRIHFKVIGQFIQNQENLADGLAAVRQCGILPRRNCLVLHAIDLDYIRRRVMGRSTWWRRLREYIL